MSRDGKYSCRPSVAGGAEEGVGELVAEALGSAGGDDDAVGGEGVLLGIEMREVDPGGLVEAGTNERAAGFGLVRGPLPGTARERATGWGAGAGGEAAVEWK